MSRLHVRTPASTSNLGPGFDLLGLALELWLEVECEGSPGPQHELVLADDASTTWPAARHNLLCTAFDLALEHFGARPRPSRFEVRSEIPLCRGLGSSGAAIAAGLQLGALTAGVEEPDLLQLAELGLALEGHPDNSTASLFGGCTLAVPLEGGALKVVQQPLAESLIFAVAWPSRVVSTEDARRVLPDHVRFEDAVENPRRLALLLEGLRTAEPELLALGTQDRLHVAARTALIPGAHEAVQAALEAGAFAATISGSGSTLIALHTEERVATQLAEVMASELRKHNDWAEGRALCSALEGCQVRTEAC